MVSLDGAPPPLGLRDLPIVLAGQSDWNVAQEQAVAGVAQALKTKPPTAGPPAVAPQMQRDYGKAAQASVEPASKKRRAKPPRTKVAAKAKKKGGVGPLFWMIALLALIGAGAFAFDQLRYAIFDWAPEDFIAPGVGVLVSIVLLVWLFRKGFASDKTVTVVSNIPLPEPEEEEQRPIVQTGGAVFVSYAHDDAVAVGPVVAAVERAGRPVWIDKTDINAGAGWAGEIVRAIKGAEGVMVVCTPAAFRSDHVKREVYLADRYQKPLMPVMLAPASLPEDFEYFFAGVQWLELHRIPEAERAAAIKHALSGA
jgi:hypothetical protein